MGEASFRQQNGAYAVGIVGACGVITPVQLSGLAALAPELGIAAFKLSTRQTIIAVLPGDNVKALTEAVAGLGLRVGTFGSAVRSVKACCGTDGLCARTLADAHSLGVTLQDRFMDKPAPKDFKIAVAGCHRGCTDPLCADFGAIGNPARVAGGFDVYIGGRGGSKKPRHAQQILTSIAPEAVAEALEYVLIKYRALAEPHERLCHVIDRVGLAEFVPPASGQPVTKETADGPAAAVQTGGAGADFLAFASGE